MNSGCSKVLSFCIPVKNRLDALRMTLGQNLEDNIDDSQDIEFVVNCFDADDSATRDFIFTSFSEHIASGYLAYNRVDYLPAWHFGIAKNSFREVMNGSIYSSLDADNFTGFRAGRLIIDTFSKYNYRCLLHQFGGDWGDGTCGRLSLASHDYRKIGYDTKFLPRQWDEIDLILATIVQCKRVYICYQGNSIFAKSQPLERFITEQNIEVKQVEIEEPLSLYSRHRGRRSIDTHSSDYVQKHSRLRSYSTINHHISYLKNSTGDHNRAVYLKELIECQRELLKTDETTAILHDVFEDPGYLDSLLAKNSPNQLTLITVAADDPNLSKWCDYYFKLGVDRIFIVDTDSRRVTSQRLRDKSSVYCLVPRYGEFVYAKSFWAELIAKTFCMNHWVLTLDTDEYIILPPVSAINPQYSKGRNLPAITEVADQNSINYISGLLIDCVGVQRASDSNTDCSSPCIQDMQAIFNTQTICFRQSPCTPPSDYSHHPTAVWSYGSHAKLAFQYDLRFRYNASIDCLRKLPLFKCSAKISLNQGFHDIRTDGIRCDPVVELSSGMILPIAHAKFMTSTFLNRNLKAYHQESAINIAKLARNFRSTLERFNHDPFIVPLCKFPFYRFINARPFSRLFLLENDASSTNTGAASPERLKDQPQYLLVPRVTESHMLEAPYQDRLLIGLVQLILDAYPSLSLGVATRGQRPLSSILRRLHLEGVSISSQDVLEIILDSLDVLLVGRSLAKHLSERHSLLCTILSASIKTKTFIAAPLSLFRTLIPAASDELMIEQLITIDQALGLASIRKEFNLGACIMLVLSDIVSSRRCPYLLLAPSLFCEGDSLLPVFSRYYSLPII